MYELWNSFDKVLEVLVMSFDKKDAQFANTHPPNVPWVAIPWQERDDRSLRMRKRFNLTDLPGITVINAETLETVFNEDESTNDLWTWKAGEITKWLSKVRGRV